MSETIDNIEEIEVVFKGQTKLSIYIEKNKTVRDLLNKFCIQTNTPGYDSKNVTFYMERRD